MRQHVEIRARLRGIERLAKSANKPQARRHLVLSLHHLASVFDEHLAFEERELLPLVRDVDAWGAVRAGSVLAEHVEQRTRIERVVALAENGDVHGRELAGEVRWLTQTLVADMDSEEAELSGLEQLEAVGSPQNTG